MPEIDLVLKADNTDYIKNIKQAQTETQKLYNFATQGRGKLKTSIQQEEVILKELQQFKKKAAAEDVKYYNEAIAQSEKRMTAYEKEAAAVEDTGKKSEKSGGLLSKGMMMWGAAIGGVTAALGFLKSAMESTGPAADRLEEMTMGVAQGFEVLKRAVINMDFKDFIKNVQEAYKEGERYAKGLDIVDEKTRALRVSEADAQKFILEQTLVSRTAKTKQEQVDAAQRVIDKENELAGIRTNIAQIAYDNEVKNIAQITKLTEAEVLAYVKQEGQIMKNIEAGKLFNEQKVEYNNLVRQSTSSTGLLVDQKRLQELDDIMKAATPELLRFADAQQKMATDTKFDVLVSKYSELRGAETSALERTMRIQTQALNKETKLGGEGTKAQKKEYDERIANEKKYFELSQKLVADADKANIESLSGVDKLKAQRDLGLKQIDEAKAQLAAVGAITPEQEDMFTKMGQIVWDSFKDGVAKEMKKNPIDVIPLVLKDQQKHLEDEIAKQKIKFNIIPEVGIDTASIDTTKLTEDQKLLVEKLKNTNELQKVIPIPITIKPEVLMEGYPDMTKLAKGPEMPKTAKKQLTSVWELIGIDPETDDGQQMINSIKETSSAVIGIMDEMYQARVDDAQRTRELLDTQIAEANEALNQEIELQKAGYASNVAGKKKEVEELQKQRDSALKKEEEAIKRQRQLDSIQQTSSLLTATANIFASMTQGNPIGTILAIVSIATMWAVFAASKLKAAAATKLEKGGYGEVHGRTHSLGGESFTDHIEVEDQEKWGVLSRPASKKYGKAFYQVVDGFNKDNTILINKAFSILNPDFAGGKTVEKYKLERFNISTERVKFERVSTDVFNPVNEIKNNIKIDNTGPNQRLDRINQSVEKLGKQPIKESIIETDRATIIVKGSNTRTIKR